MSKRHDKLGIKQGLRLEWLNKALNLKLAGLNDKEIRHELTNYLANRLDNGLIGQRGESTNQIAVSMLSKIWINPDKELLNLQIKALNIARKTNDHLPCHWAMLCAAYPFWHKVALKTGRLFNLQEQVSKKQIIQRIREEYGDRSSVIRSAQRVIQGFLGLEIIEESENKNYYKIIFPKKYDSKIAILLYESALHADSEGKATLGLLKNNPAFFPFQLPMLTGNFISQHSNAIDVVHCGLSDELLKLRN